MSIELDKLSSEGLSEFRCTKCKKLLAIFNRDSLLESKCVRCGTLNVLLGKMAEQVIITDAQGKILFVNGEIEKITGYTEEETIGKTPALWGGQMSAEFYKDMWHTILEKKQNITVKVTNRHKSGKLYQALLRVSPILDTQGEIKFLIGFESIIQ